MALLAVALATMVIFCAATFADERTPAAKVVVLEVVPVRVTEPWLAVTFVRKVMPVPTAVLPDSVTLPVPCVWMPLTPLTLFTVKPPPVVVMAMLPLLAVLRAATVIAPALIRVMSPAATADTLPVNAKFLALKPPALMLADKLPAPPTVWLRVVAVDLLKIKLALLDKVTLPKPKLPVLPPLPICKPPPLTVVAPL